MKNVEDDLLDCIKPLSPCVAFKKLSETLFSFRLRQSGEQNHVLWWELVKIALFYCWCYNSL